MAGRGPAPPLPCGASLRPAIDLCHRLLDRHEAMKLVCAFGLFAVFAFVLYGWGLAVRKLVGAQSRGWPTPWPATAATGMAALVFVGGVLNLTRLAYPWALAIVAIA